MILRTILSPFERGFYIDVGAHDPVRFSNTFYFYRNGWSGINIDPLPGCMKKFNTMMFALIIILILSSHRNFFNSKISDKLLLDDVIYEVTWNGDKVWEWVCSDHRVICNTCYRNMLAPDRRIYYDG